MTIQLESDLLRSFVAVADLENFTRAADALGRTQSAISMQMKRLEELVGDPLFERGPRGIALTRLLRRLLERLAPEDDMPAPKLLTHHQVVAIDFADKEIAGDPDSLASIRETLNP